MDEGMLSAVANLDDNIGRLGKGRVDRLGLKRTPSSSLLRSRRAVRPGMAEVKIFSMKESSPGTDADQWQDIWRRTCQRLCP